MNLSFEYYKVFYYVSKYGSLTRAASVLMTSQPAVTRTIHNLENELGCRLFIRSKKGIELTPEGRLFYDYVSRGCALILKGEHELKNIMVLDNGTIYISATETALHCYLFQAMEEFNVLYPNVCFKILNHSSIDSVQALKAGKIDMAIVSADSFPIEKPLKVEQLRRYQNILIGGSKFEHLKSRSVSLKELKDYPWISLTSKTITRDILDQYFESNGLIFEPKVELATTDLILPAVRHNLGIGFIPTEFVSEDILQGTVFKITVEEKLPERNIILVYDTEYPQSIAARKFQQFLHQR